MSAVIRIRTDAVVPIETPDQTSARLDETAMFSTDQAAFLASRGLVFLTDRRLDDRSGRMASIVAGSLAQAEAIATSRGHAERVVGMMGQSFLRNLKIRILKRQ